ncbi:hypothetical protein QBC39DRAFT_419720 [Podospora conica]|nr:hypothetical protein QBC39DRAFT_419720 [Schizothecium conicum]
MAPTEITVQATAPLPPGYRFIPKGDVYITKNCRLRTLAANRPFYIVHDARDRRIGLRCPASIAAAVEADSHATAATRAAAVKKRDASHEKAFEAAVLELFPQIPRELVPGVVKHAVEKRSGRVGRTGTLDVGEKAKLAVRAHIRHKWTAYDALLRGGMSREDARRAVADRLSEVAKAWGGEGLWEGKGKGKKGKGKGRKVKVGGEAGKKGAVKKKKAGTVKGGAAAKGTVKRATATEVIDLTDLTDGEDEAVEMSSGEDEIFILSDSGSDEEESESDWSDSDADDGPAIARTTRLMARRNAA